MLCVNISLHFKLHCSLLLDELIENNLWPSETTIDSKLLLDVYVRVIIMINFINRISGHANSSQRIQQKRKNNDVANFCYKHCTEAS